MSSNSAIILQELCEEFESMLHYVQHSENETAYAAERTIFKRLLKLGHSLMVLFFALQAERCSRTALETETGDVLPYHSEKKRDYYSIFGKLAVWRPYFYKQGVGSASPLDEALSLGEDCYSDVVREIAEYLGAASAYEKVVDLFHYLLGQSLGKNAVQLMVAEDAGDVEAYYEQKDAPAVSEEGHNPGDTGGRQGGASGEGDRGDAKSAIGQRGEAQQEERSGGDQRLHHRTESPQSENGRSQPIPARKARDRR